MYSSSVSNPNSYYCCFIPISLEDPGPAGTNSAVLVMQEKDGGTCGEVVRVFIKQTVKGGFGGPIEVWKLEMGTQMKALHSLMNSSGP